MAQKWKKVLVYICERCQYEWQSRRNEHPRICPRCKSELWNKPKK